MSDTIFTSRAKRGPACDYIDLNEAESKIYTGCGLRLAQVKQGQITAMFDAATLPYEENLELAAANAARAAFAWAGNHNEGSLWLGECSCYQFCMPKLVNLKNANHIAHVSHAIQKYLREMSE